MVNASAVRTSHARTYTHLALALVRLPACALQLAVQLFDGCFGPGEHAGALLQGVVALPQSSLEVPDLQEGGGRGARPRGAHQALGRFTGHRTGGVGDGRHVSAVLGFQMPPPARLLAACLAVAGVACASAAQLPKTCPVQPLFDVQNVSARVFLDLFGAP